MNELICYRFDYSMIDNENKTKGVEYVYCLFTSISENSKKVLYLGTDENFMNEYSTICFNKIGAASKLVCKGLIMEIIKKKYGPLLAPIKITNVSKILPGFHVVRDELRIDIVNDLKNMNTVFREILDCNFESIIMNPSTDQTSALFSPDKTTREMMVRFLIVQHFKK